MGSEPASDIENKLPQRRGSENAIHPLGSESSTLQSFRPFRRWFPWLVPSFALANVILFVITMFVNNCPKNSAYCLARSFGRFSFQPFKENPLLGPSSSTLVKMGALDVHKVVYGHQGWRLITCIWLHAGVFHLLANMLSLLFIGIRLEQEFGFVRIGMIYVLSGVGGSLLSALFIQNSISVGASGALFGLLGAMLSELLTNWTIYANKFAALFTLLVIIVINLAVGVLPHVDNFAHIGGFLSGFLLGFVFLVRPQFGWVSQKLVHSAYGTAHPSPKRKHKMYQYILWVLSLILLIAGFTVGFIMVMRGVDANKNCSWCHYLSCVPINGRSCKGVTVNCESFQTGNSLNVTCQGSGKYHIYQLSNPSDAEIKELCIQLCS